MNGDKHKKFPIYANEIENQCQKLWERLELIGEGSNNLCKVFPSSITESDKELPKELSERVVELLSNIDIKNLNEAVRSTYSETTHVYSEELKSKKPNDISNSIENNTSLQSEKKNKLSAVTVSILAIAGVTLGIAIAVYLEMPAVGIAVGACCLVIAAIIYYCNKPSKSLENSNAEAVVNQITVQNYNLRG